MLITNYLYLYMDFSESKVKERIAQIRRDKHITKRDMAYKLGVDESNYGRLELGKTSLSYEQLAKIASVFAMSVIDVLSYPATYVLNHDVEQEQTEPLEAVLQIKLKKDKRDQVLNLIFGDNNLELLMK